jgi:hypothetical protein
VVLGEHPEVVDQAIEAIVEVQGAEEAVFKDLSTKALQIKSCVCLALSVSRRRNSFFCKHWERLFMRSKAKCFALLSCQRKWSVFNPVPFPKLS